MSWIKLGVHPFSKSIVGELCYSSASPLQKGQTGLSAAGSPFGPSRTELAHHHVEPASADMIDFCISAGWKAIELFPVAPSVASSIT
jgi:hypothetical protein